MSDSDISTPSWGVSHEELGSPQGHSTKTSSEGRKLEMENIDLLCKMRELEQQLTENQANEKENIELLVKMKGLEQQLAESQANERKLQSQLTDRLFTKNYLEKEVRNRNEELEKKVTELQEKINLEKEVRNRNEELEKKVTELQEKIRVKDQSSKQDPNHKYSTLNNLIIEVKEYIEDIEQRLMLEEIVIGEMSNDRIQKLVRDTQEYDKANERIISLKGKIRNELSSDKYSHELKKRAVDTIETLTEVKSRLGITCMKIETEANERKIKYCESDIDMSEFYQAPTFTGSKQAFNIYEFFQQLEAYLEATKISPDEHGAVLKSCLKGTALGIVNKAYPNTFKPPISDVKTLLKKHFGKFENIISDLQTQHEQIGKIPEIGTGDMNKVYKKSSDHACLIQKVLMLENNGCQVELPKAYIDSIERMLPPNYKDKYTTYEITYEDATPREKLLKLKELVDEIEAKGLIKSSLSNTLVPETKDSKNDDDDDDDDDDYERYNPKDGEDEEEYYRKYNKENEDKNYNDHDDTEEHYNDHDDIDDQEDSAGHASLATFETMGRMANRIHTRGYDYL